MPITNDTECPRRSGTPKAGILRGIIAEIHRGKQEIRGVAEGAATGLPLGSRLKIRAIGAWIDEAAYPIEVPLPGVAGQVELAPKAPSLFCRSHRRDISPAQIAGPAASCISLG